MAPLDFILTHSVISAPDARAQPARLLPGHPRRQYLTHLPNPLTAQRRQVPLLATLPVIRMMDRFEYQVLIAYLLVQEFYGHAGCEHKGRSFGPFPWLPTALGIDLRADDHQWHHIDGRYNFSKRFILWDIVFGTFRPRGVISPPRAGQFT